MSTLFERTLEYMGEGGYGDLPGFTLQYLDLGPKPAEDKAELREERLDDAGQEVANEQIQPAEAQPVRKRFRRLHGFFV